MLHETAKIVVAWETRKKLVLRGRKPAWQGPVSFD